MESQANEIKVIAGMIMCERNEVHVNMNLKVEIKSRRQKYDIFGMVHGNICPREISLQVEERKIRFSFFVTE